MPQINQQPLVPQLGTDDVFPISQEQNGAYLTFRASISNILAFTVPINGGVVMGGPLGADFTFAPEASAVQWPVGVTALAVPQFNGATLDVPAQGSTLAAVGQMDAMVTDLTGNLTGGGHAVGHVGWNVVIGAGNAPLVIGAEAKLDILATGTIGLGIALNANINQVPAGTNTGALTGVNAQLATVAGNVPLYSALNVNIGAVEAGGSIGVVAGLNFAPPTSNAGTIGSAFGLWVQDWRTIVPDLPTSYGILIQDPRFTIDTVGSVVAAAVSTPALAATGGTISGTAITAQSRTGTIVADLVPTIADAGGFIGANLSASGTITMPVLPAGVRFDIADVAGNGATYPPTFAAAPGSFINGGTAYVPTTDWWGTSWTSLGSGNFSVKAN